MTTTITLREQHQAFTDTTAAYLAGEDVPPGDCWRTAIACLLEVPRDEVPHFIADYPLEDDVDVELGPQWWQESVAWVEQQMPGWTLRCWTPGNYPFYTPEQASNAPDRVILTGQSPRGDWPHVVLVDGATGVLAWDPFPGGQGVLEPLVDIIALVRKEWVA